MLIALVVVSTLLFISLVAHVFLYSEARLWRARVNAAEAKTREIEAELSAAQAKIEDLEIELLIADEAAEEWEEDYGRLQSGVLDAMDNIVAAHDALGCDCGRDALGDALGDLAGALDCGDGGGCECCCCDCDEG